MQRCGKSQTFYHADIKSLWNDSDFPLTLYIYVLWPSLSIFFCHCLDAIFICISTFHLYYYRKVSHTTIIWMLNHHIDIKIEICLQTLQVSNTLKQDFNTIIINKQVLSDMSFIDLIIIINIFSILKTEVANLRIHCPCFEREQIS